MLKMALEGNLPRPSESVSATPAQVQWDEPCQRETQGDSSDGERANSPDSPSEDLAVVEMRERLVRHLNPQELAQRPPSFLDLVDQQLLGRGPLLELLVVPLEGLDGVFAVLKPTVEIPI